MSMIIVQNDDTSTMTTSTGIVKDDQKIGVMHVFIKRMLFKATIYPYDDHFPSSTNQLKRWMRVGEINQSTIKTKA